VEVPSREGKGPKERRLMPEVERRATCFVVPGVEVSSWTGGPGMEFEEVVLPVVRLRLRMVMLEGIPTAPRALGIIRGEERGGVLIGAGSLERAD